MRYLVLMLGSQGAGKSSWLRTQFLGHPVVSADSYLFEGGQYVWTQERSSLAHARCEVMAATVLASGCDLVFVDNTNAFLERIQPYIQIASEQRVRVGFVYINAGLSVSLAEQTHGASEATVERFWLESRQTAQTLVSLGYGVVAVCRTAGGVYATTTGGALLRGYGTLCNPCRVGRGGAFDSSLPCSHLCSDPCDEWTAPLDAEQSSVELIRFLFSLRTKKQ